MGGYQGVCTVGQTKGGRLAEGEGQWERANGALQSKRAAFAVVFERVSALKRSLAEAQREQARLHEQVRLGYGLGLGFRHRMQRHWMSDQGCRLIEP